MKVSFRFPHTPSSHATREYRRRVLMMLTVLIVVLPLAWRGASCGHDFDFHLQSWLEVARSWRHGILYPHWDMSANYGAGEPRFVFYPPLTWVAGAAMGTVLPWTWTPLAFTLLALTGCVYGFYAMACEWMPRDAATVAACLYMVNPYLLFVAYERAAYGELASAIGVPLLVLFALRSRPALVPLALVVAALWLTNAPAAVMGCYFLAMIAVVGAIVERRAVLLARAAAAVPLGLGLAAFYVVPAWYEQRWVEIARAVAPGMRVEDSFLFGHTGEPFHDHVLWTASWIAMALMAAAFAGSLLARLQRPLLARRRRGGLWFPLTIASGVISFLLLPWSAPVWHSLPELGFLQFPWRWLLVLAVAAAALIGLALGGSLRDAPTRGAIRTRALTVMAAAVLMALVASHFFWQPCDEEDNVRAQMRTLGNGGSEGTDEYTAKGVDNGEIEQGMPLVRLLKMADGEQAANGSGSNPEWKPDAAEEIAATVRVTHGGPERFDLAVASPVAGFAVLRLMDYPAWRVRVNGLAVAGRLRRADGLMVVPLTAGFSRVSVDYGATPDAWTGRGISLASLLALFVLARRRNRVG